MASGASGSPTDPSEATSAAGTPAGSRDPRASPTCIVSASESTSCLAATQRAGGAIGVSRGQKSGARTGRLQPNCCGCVHGN
eukprot:2198788-Pyramimonas_sp.AAC.1